MTCTWVEINKEAFYHNVAQARAMIGPDVKLGIVLKANAYGHGLTTMALLAENNSGIDWAFTVQLSEAVQIRAEGFSKPVCSFVLDDWHLEKAIQHTIDLVCNSFELLQQIGSIAAKLKKTARIHIKIDTGMTRLGIFPHELEQFVSVASTYQYVVIVGIMSHFCDSNNQDFSFTQQQRDTFNLSVQEIKKTILNLEWIHLSSSGSLLLAEGHTAVRIGTGLYGYWKSPLQKERFLAQYPSMTLRPILTWKTRIIQIKTVSAGSVVGYDCTYQTARITKVAMLPVGYYDGYARGLSNCGTVLIRGQHVSIIGRVSMNLAAIDVTDVAGAETGDEVILLGDYPGLTVGDCAQKTGTINLAILTAINSSIKRVVV